MASDDARQDGGETRPPESQSAARRSAEQPTTPSADEVGDAIGNLTDSELRRVGGFLAAGMEASDASGNPIASRVNEIHLTAVIGLMDKELEYRHSDRQRARVFWGLVATFLITLLIMFAVFLALWSMDFLLADIIKGGALLLCGAAAGFGAGYGFAKRNL